MTSSFTALGVSEELARALTRCGITTPFAIQAAALPEAVAGLDILGESPTGSGKTLAFGLPLIERTAGAHPGPAGLVLSPTRELANQIAQELAPLAAARRVQVAAVFGGVPLAGQAARARTAGIVVATPGRLNDLIERRLIDLSRIRVLVLDEADRMLDMGFRPQVDRIVGQLPENRQTMLFSATLDGPVAELAAAFTVNPVRVRAGAAEGTEPGHITHTFVGVSAESKLDWLVGRLATVPSRAIVFVRTKHGADKLVRKLGQRKVDAVALHGNLSQSQRRRALERFASTRMPALVATDIAARGLDIEDVSHVINFDPPNEDVDYVHRIGRTGRAGRTGEGITLVLPEQAHDIAALARRLGYEAELYAAGLGSPAPRRERGRARRRGKPLHAR